MHLETRLARLEARYAAEGPARIQIVRPIVDPALGVTHAVARSSDGSLRSFERLPTETPEQLGARALNAAA